jgi:hypothetical protein
MNETLTSPIPLLGNGDQPELADRFTSQNRIGFKLISSLETFSTRSLGAFELPSRQTEEPTVEEMYTRAIWFFFRAKQAEVKGEITRPIILFEPREALYSPDLRLGHWVRQMTGEKNNRMLLRNVQLLEEALAPPEFGWSVSFYKARKAAQAFSEETHADY